MRTYVASESLAGGHPDGGDVAMWKEVSDERYLAAVRKIVDDNKCPVCDAELYRPLNGWHVYCPTHGCILGDCVDVDGKDMSLKSLGY